MLKETKKQKVKVHKKRAVKNEIKKILALPLFRYLSDILNLFLIDFFFFFLTTIFLHDYFLLAIRNILLYSVLISFSYVYV